MSEAYLVYAVYADELKAQLLKDDITKLVVHSNDGNFVEYHRMQWIPCEDRLPGEYSDVLCCDIYGEYIIGMPYANDESNTGFSVETDDCYMLNCVAWMPLPEPWKGEQE